MSSGAIVTNITSANQDINFSSFSRRLKFPDIDYNVCK
jgi:hypothetical protein